MKVKILNKTPLLDGFFKIEDVFLQHEKFSGEMSKPLHRYNIDRGEAAAALIYLKDNDSLIFVKQFRYAAYQAKESGWKTEIVAGILEDDDPETCIRRECREEAGFEIDNFEPVIKFFASPGITNEQIHLFIALTKSSKKIYKGGGLEEEHEDISIIEMKRDDVWKKMNSNYFTDGKTLLALQHFFLHQKDLLK